MLILNNILKNKYILKHGMISLIGRIISMPLAVLFNIFIARSLSPSDYGVIGLMIQIITFTQTISMFGYREILIKYIPQHYQNKNYHKLGGLIWTSLSISLFSTVLFITILNLFSQEISNLYEEPNLRIIIPYFSVNLLLTILCFNSNSLLISVKKVWQANVSERTIMNLSNCLMLLILYLFEISLDLINISLILIIGKFTSLVLSLVYSKDLFKMINFSSIYIRDNLKLSLNLLFSEITLKIVATLSPLIIGLYLNSEEIAFYYTAFLLANLASFLISMSNNLISNSVSNLFHENKLSKIIALNKKSSVLLGAVGVVLMIFYLIFGKFVLGFWGPQYIENSYIVLLILTFGELVNCFGGCSGLIISTCGLEKKGLHIALVSSVINIFLQFTLIQRFGIIGAAIATAFSVIIFNVLKLLIIYSSLKK